MAHNKVMSTPIIFFFHAKLCRKKVDKNQFFCRCSVRFLNLELLRNHSLDAQCYSGFPLNSVENGDDAAKKDEISDNNSGHNQKSTVEIPSSSNAMSSKNAFDKPPRQVPHTEPDKQALPKDHKAKSSKMAETFNDPGTLESPRNKLFLFSTCLSR
jgi:hypothetical protein